MTRDEKLHQALQLLYDSSSRFRVSVDTIQRLAKHLTLDTFVDSEALASPRSRLSIAGQLLLLDVDFSADNDIHDIALSSGSHLSNSQNNTDASQPPNLDSCIGGEVQDGAKQRWQVSLKKGGGFSFFHNAGGVGAESILRANLKGPVLGAFSDNLAYLATLDRLSPPEGDLIATMDHIALYLALVHHKEKELDSRKDVLSGTCSLFGAILLNDEASGRLGIFLRFWERNGFKKTNTVKSGNQSGESNTVKSGNQPGESNTVKSDYQSDSYLARLSVQASETPVNYFHDTQTKPWRILNKDVVLALDKESLDCMKKNSSAQNWHLLLSLDTAMSLPKNLVEYLGLVCSLELACNSGQESENFTCENGTDGRISFYFEDASPLVRIKEFPLSSLHQLAKVVPALRNQITLSALMHSVLDSWRVISDEAAELSPETTKKIRSSLKLADDVPDEELMGLNSIPNDIMSTDRSESGLEDFMKDEYAENEDDERGGIKSKELTFSLVEILYDTPYSDYIVRITGTLTDSETIDSQMVISNGQISEYGDVDMDSAVQRRFIKALSLSEDIPLSLKAMREGV